MIQRVKTILPKDKIMTKNNFDIEAKDHGHTDVMNVCDTLSHGDTRLCQIWNDYGQKKRP